MLLRPKPMSLFHLCNQKRAESSQNRLCLSFNSTVIMSPTFVGHIAFGLFVRSYVRCAFFVPPVTLEPCMLGL